MPARKKSGKKKKNSRPSYADRRQPPSNVEQTLTSGPPPGLVAAGIFNQSAIEAIADETVSGVLRQALSWSVDGPKNIEEAALVAKFVPTQDCKLHLACELGEVQIVASMLSSGTGNTNMRYKDGSNPLLIASQRGHVAVATLLVTSGSTPLDCKWVGNGSATPLIIWCEHGNMSMVRLLLSKGASPNLADVYGSTPLYSAASRNHHHLLPLLYEAHADPNRKRIDGSTAILVAAERGFLSVLESLYSHGGDLNARLNDGSTCLSLAVQNHHTTIAKKLLSWGCVANVVDAGQCSPLWIAASRGHVDLITPLLRGAVGMLFLDDLKHNMNPMEIAGYTNNTEVLAHIAAFLPSFGNNPPSVITCVYNNVQALVAGDRAKQSIQHLLGMEDVLMAVSQVAGPTCRDAKLGSATPKDPPIEAKSARENGNRLFKEKKFNDAIREYESAISLDSQCPLSPSNAAEAALQLCDFAGALSYALLAHEIDPMHKKTWFRFMRSLAGLSRASEAYVWIADLVQKLAVDREDEVNLFRTVSKNSPCCYQFLPGLVIEKGFHGQYHVVTRSPIKSQQVLSKEIAVVPWCNQDVVEEARLAVFLANFDPEKTHMINGIFPRNVSEMPTDVKSISSLDEKMRTLIPAVSEDERAEMQRVLACAKVCAFDNGIHHFASFYNHSCTPNCEVRSINNLEVVTNRDIAAGEKLCISYIQMDFLDYPAVARQRNLKRGWGFLCFCSRCVDESKQPVTESEVFAFDTATLPVKHFGHPRMLPSDDIVNDWQEVPWKKRLILSKQFKLLEHAVKTIFRCILSKLDNNASSLDEIAQAELIVNNMGILDERGATQCLILMIEERRTFLPKESAGMHNIYKTLKRFIDIFVSTGRLGNVEGLRTRTELLKWQSELLEDLLRITDCTK
jgi:ankyrin repeat protein/tetratricopeptide (TPR) repeat protein